MAGMQQGYAYADSLILLVPQFEGHLIAMDILNSEVSASHFTLVSATFVLLLTIATAKLLFPSNPGGSLPLHGAEYGISPRRVLQYMYNAQSMYLEAYSKFRNTVYRITTADGEKVVVPLKYVEELRSKPEEEINNAKALEKVFETKITGLTTETHFLNHLIRADLTKKLPQIIGRLAEEVERSVRTELPQAETWTSININERVSRVLAIVSGNVLVGPPLCYDEEYLHAAMNYSKDISAAIRALKIWPRFMRPTVQHFTPQVGVIRKYRGKAKKMLEPLIKELRSMRAKGNPLPDTMLAWMVEKAEQFQADDDELANTQLILIMAGIHTRTMTITHILYDLAAYPECVEDLRDEINAVLAENNGVMSAQALFQMKLLDSFLLESQRHNPPAFSDMSSSPSRSRTGHRSRQGSSIETPHIAVTKDPEFYPDPETFDPYRFYRLRKGETPDPIGHKNTEQYQFVTVTKENMGFGYGRHACPGRFFAAAEIKLLLARILLEYDRQDARWSGGAALCQRRRGELLYCRY
ncbi:cytochrome P450 [Diplogelasinospora grovesii]|uniref:Cytochrome P450 n=1 Tax=Diplogelasinospora grovesii TaxID=303347 RepID=A0AAN6N851_9PEZI|nr:cytochrome P450 [Diplogelasinospora grovesii]